MVIETSLFRLPMFDWIEIEPKVSRKTSTSPLYLAKKYLFCKSFVIALLHFSVKRFKHRDELVKVLKRALKITVFMCYSM